MGFVNELDIDGYLTPTGNVDSGTLSIIDGILTGSTSLPKTIDRTAIHYDTKANWDRQTFLIAERGHIYIYKDAEYSYVNGEKVLYCGIKVGDGSSYLIDMPYVVISNDRERLINHINNYVIHVSGVDRVKWNEKVSVTVDGDSENLIFDN